MSQYPTKQLCIIYLSAFKKLHEVLFVFMSSSCWPPQVSAVACVDQHLHHGGSRLVLQAVQPLDQLSLSFHRKGLHNRPLQNKDL